MLGKILISGVIVSAFVVVSTGSTFAASIEAECQAQVAAMDDALQNNKEVTDDQRDRLEMERNMTKAGCDRGGDNAEGAVMSSKHNKSMFQEEWGVIIE